MAAASGDSTIIEDPKDQLDDKALLKSVRVAPKKATNAKEILNGYLNRTFNSSFRDITKTATKKKKGSRGTSNMSPMSPSSPMAAFGES